MPIIKTLLGLRPTQTQRHPLPQPQEQLVGERVLLRIGTPLDWQSWREIRAENHAFLAPWEPSWPNDALTYEYFCRNIRRQWREWRDGQGYAFLIFHKDHPTGEVIGGISLNDVHRGIGQKGTVGYWIGERYAGQGLMTEAASLVMSFAFEKLRLHRIEASCMPGNEPSRRLLAKLGFEEEGLARAYLRINGRWEDHLLLGKLG